MSLAEFLNDPRPPAKPSAGSGNPAAKLRKQVFLEFGAIVFLGLLLAGWYVGFRIVAAPSTPQPVAPVATIVVKSPVAPPPPLAMPAPAEVKPPAPALEKPNADTTVPVPSARSEKPPDVKVPISSHDLPAALGAAIAPKPAFVGPMPQALARRDASPRAGEKYLQIAAFGPRALNGYLKTLEKQGLHPVVAPGPVDNIYRILIGPFPNSAALEETRHLIQSSGIQPILRSY
jgi:hypothetical protein